MYSVGPLQHHHFCLHWPAISVQSIDLAMGASRQMQKEKASEACLQQGGSRGVRGGTHSPPNPQQAVQG